MKFEGIEIALEGIWYEDNRWKSAQFQFPRISNSLKASAEESPSPELEACMLNGKSEYYCIKGELEVLF